MFSCALWKPYWILLSLSLFLCDLCDFLSLWSALLFAINLQSSVGCLKEGMSSQFYMICCFLPTWCTVSVSSQENTLQILTELTEMPFPIILFLTLPLCLELKQLILIISRYNFLLKNPPFGIEWALEFMEWRTIGRND